MRDGRHPHGLQRYCPETSMRCGWLIRLTSAHVCVGRPPGDAVPVHVVRPVYCPLARGLHFGQRDALPARDAPRGAVRQDGHGDLLGGPGVRSPDGFCGGMRDGGSLEGGLSESGRGTMRREECGGGGGGGRRGCWKGEGARRGCEGGARRDSPSTGGGGPTVTVVVSGPFRFTICSRWRQAVVCPFARATTGHESEERVLLEPYVGSYAGGSVPSHGELVTWGECRRRRP